MNGSSQIQDVGFDQSYSLMVNDGSLIINIAITSMHRFSSIILNVSNAL